jgi:hypothetical protein
VSDSNLPNNALRLKTLLKEANVKSTRLDTTRRLIMYGGRTRDWTFIVNIFNGWLHVRTYVCEIPTAAGLCAELLDAAMTANYKMSLTKFVKADELALELEYRDEHLDATVIGSLLALALANAEEYYPRLFRIVSGDSVLHALSGDPLVESGSG